MFLELDGIEGDSDTLNASPFHALEDLRGGVSAGAGDIGNQSPRAFAGLYANLFRV
jgi:hypothetical protein